MTEAIARVRALETLRQLPLEGAGRISDAKAMPATSQKAYLDLVRKAA